MGDRKQRWKESIQTIYLSGDDDKLYHLLRPIIHSKAKRYGRLWKWTELTAEDFCSEFWEVTWNLVEQPYKRTGYLFYDTWELAVSRRAVNLIRRATQTRQLEFENEAVRVGDRIVDMAVDHRDMETTVINRLYVQSILTDNRLSPTDRQLLQTIYRNPDSSFQQIAQMVGLRWSQQVIRRLDGIRRRLIGDETDRTENPGAKTEFSV